MICLQLPGQRNTFPPQSNFGFLQVPMLKKKNCLSFCVLQYKNKLKGTKIKGLPAKRHLWGKIHSTAFLKQLMS